MCHKLFQAKSQEIFEPGQFSSIEASIFTLTFSSSSWLTELPPLLFSSFLNEFYQILFYLKLSSSDFSGGHQNIIKPELDIAELKVHDIIIPDVTFQKPFH